MLVVVKHGQAVVGRPLFWEDGRATLDVAGMSWGEAKRYQEGQRERLGLGFQAPELGRFVAAELAPVPAPQFAVRELPMDTPWGTLRMPGENLPGVSFSRRHDMAGADLRGCNLAGADFRLCDLRGARFTGSDMEGARFDGANLSFTNLSGCDLRGAKFDGATLNRCALDAAWLEGATFEGAHVRYCTALGASVLPGVWSGAEVCGVLPQG